MAWLPVGGSVHPPYTSYQCYGFADWADSIFLLRCFVANFKCFLSERETNKAIHSNLFTLVELFTNPLTQLENDTLLQVLIRSIHKPSKLLELLCQKIRRNRTG